MTLSSLLRKIDDLENDLKNIKHQAKHLVQRISILCDMNEGLQAELNEAVSVAMDRGATEWAILNFPKHPKVLALDENTIRAAWASVGREPPVKHTIQSGA